MKLSEAISESSINDLKDSYPGGISFKNKTRLLGVSHDRHSGVDRIVIPIDLIESENWGISFEMMSKEWAECIGGLFDYLGANDPLEKVNGNKSESEYKAYFDHPCKSSCDGWMAGYRTAQKDMQAKLSYLDRLAEKMAGAKTKSRGFYIKEFRDQIKFLQNGGFLK